MYCTRCGTQMPAAAHFCPGCGMAVGGNPSAGDPVSGTPPAAQPQRSRRAAPVLIGGAVLIIAAAVVAAVLHRAPPVAAAPTLPATPVHDGAPLGAPGAPVPAAAAPTAAMPTPATPTPETLAYDWSGLSHEELVKARTALDAAIAREEHSSSGEMSAQTPR